MRSARNEAQSLCQILGKPNVRIKARDASPEGMGAMTTKHEALASFCALMAYFGAVVAIVGGETVFLGFAVGALSSMATALITIGVGDDMRQWRDDD